MPDKTETYTLMDQPARNNTILSTLHTLDHLIQDAMARGSNAEARRYAEAAHYVLSDYQDRYERNQRPTVYNSPRESLDAYETAQEVIARYPLFKNALERAARDLLSKARDAFFETYAHDPDKEPKPEPPQVAPNAPINLEG